MSTAAKASEYRNEAEVEGLAPDTEVLNYSKNLRYLTKRRKRIQDSSADEAGVEVDKRVGKGKHERMF